MISNSDVKKAQDKRKKFFNHIKQTMVYAIVITSPRKHRASYDSISNVQRAFTVLDRLAHVDMETAFKKCDIITINEAMHIEHKEAKKSRRSMHQYCDLRITYLTQPDMFFCYKKHSVADEYSDMAKHTPCSFVTFGDMMSVIKYVLKDYHLKLTKKDFAKYWNKKRKAIAHKKAENRKQAKKIVGA